MGTALLGCTLAVALSIGARRMHETLLATYVVLVSLGARVPGPVHDRHDVGGAILAGLAGRMVSERQPILVASRADVEFRTVPCARALGLPRGIDGSVRLRWPCGPPGD